MTTQQTPQPPPPPFATQAFGKYFLVDKIATGGMAEIFKAKTYSHGGFENLLVIKRILPHIGENQDFVGMFVDEARVSVALQHPNIVRVYDFGKILENYFIAMECVDGKDTRNILRKVVRRKERLPELYCAYIAHEVCKGLHYAHTKTDIHGNPYGIVHRDISPSNVLVSYEGEVKVADFGIAKAESNVYQTRDGMLKGKFEYMSPEQAQGKEIDHRSDLFSLGIILYETLTARRLFKAESEIATLKKIRDGEIAPPRTIRPELSEEVERICMKALAKAPDERYATAQEMGDDLREFLFPQTADTIRREFREFLHTLFAEEIGEERARLEAGSAEAIELRDKLAPQDWEASQSGVTMTQIPQTTVKTVVPWVAALGAGAMAVLVLLALAVGVLVATQGPGLGLFGPPAAGPTGIDVVVLPEAKISLDGEEKGVASTLTLQDLPVGEHLVKLEAEGYLPAEVKVTVEEGKLAKVVQQLEAAPAEPEPEIDGGRTKTKVSEPIGPPQIAFRSTPPGATVQVDGEVVGRTPVLWEGARLGGRYEVSMTLDGHQAAQTTIKRAKSGMQTVSLTLPAAADPGKLTVLMVGGGWANVYVDGAKLGKTAPFKELPIAVGAHEIRIENPELGVALTETHTFAAGGTITIRATRQ